MVCRGNGILGMYSPWTSMKYEYRQRSTGRWDTITTSFVWRSSSKMTFCRRFFTSTYDSPCGYRHVSLFSSHCLYSSVSLNSEIGMLSKVPASISASDTHEVSLPSISLAVWIVRCDVLVHTNKSLLRVLSDTGKPKFFSLCSATNLASSFENFFPLSVNPGSPPILPWMLYSDSPCVAYSSAN